MTTRWSITSPISSRSATTPRRWSPAARLSPRQCETIQQEQQKQLAKTVQVGRELVAAHLANAESSDKLVMLGHGSPGRGEELHRPPRRQVSADPRGEVPEPAGRSGPAQGPLTGERKHRPGGRSDVGRGELPGRLPEICWPDEPAAREPATDGRHLNDASGAGRPLAVNAARRNASARRQASFYMVVFSLAGILLAVGLGRADGTALGTSHPPLPRGDHGPGQPAIRPASDGRPPGRDRPDGHGDQPVDHRHTTSVRQHQGGRPARTGRPGPANGRGGGMPKRRSAAGRREAEEIAQRKEEQLRREEEAARERQLAEEEQRRRQAEADREARRAREEQQRRDEEAARERQRAEEDRRKADSSAAEGRPSPGRGDCGRTRRPDTAGRCRRQRGRR